MKTPKTAMKRPQNPVSKRNNVIDLRFVLPHLFVFVLQYIFVYAIFVNITVFFGENFREYFFSFLMQMIPPPS